MPPRCVHYKIEEGMSKFDIAYKDVIKRKTLVLVAI
jgi:hypothetical protein